MSTSEATSQSRAEIEAELESSPDLSWNDFYFAVTKGAIESLAQTRQSAKNAFKRNKVPKLQRTLGNFRLEEGPDGLLYPIPHHIQMNNKDNLLTTAGALLSTDAQISPDSSIGSRTTIEAGVILRGDVEIGRRSFIGPNVDIENSLIGDKVSIGEGAGIYDSKIGKIIPPKKPGDTLEVLLDPRKEISISIGRYAVLTEAFVGRGSHIGEGAIIGETRKSYVSLGENVKVEDFAVIKAWRLGKYVGSGTIVRRGKGSNIKKIRRGAKR